MTLATPELRKTWEIVPSRVITPDSTLVNGVQIDRRELLFHIKDKLTDGTFTLNWSVTMSSNGVSAGPVDHWATVADIVWGEDGSDPNTSTRSWIVLNNTAMGMHYLFDCAGAGSSRGAHMDIFVSETAYTDDGTTTSRPTNSGVEHQVLDRLTSSENEWGSGTSSSNDRTYVAHIWQSVDGLHTRIVARNSTEGYAMCWLLGTMDTALGPPTHKWYCLISKRANGFVDMCSISNLAEATNRLFAADQSDVTINCNLTALYAEDPDDEWDDAAGLASAPTPYGSLLALSGISLWSDAAGYVAELDLVPDLWWGPFRSNNPEGKTWPGSTRDFIQFNNLVFPWDQSTPITTE